MSERHKLILEKANAAFVEGDLEGGHGESRPAAVDAHGGDQADASVLPRSPPKVGKPRVRFACRQLRAQRSNS